MTLGALKPLGELVLTFEIFHSYGYRKGECERFISRAWDAVSDGEVLLNALAARPDLIVLSSLYANFKEFGCTNDRLEKLVLHLISTDSCKGLEFPYWRKLDLLHAAESLGINSMPEVADKDCWFYKCPEPWVMSNDIAYAITHDVFYLSDFGRKGTDRFSKNSLEYLNVWVPAWLKIFADQENWDIVSELLMVSQCINKKQQEDSFYALLIGAQESDGLIPSPAGAGKQLLDFELNPDKHRKRFLSNYHTCLVAGMALAMKSASV
ncbi:MAG: hypothetical protein HND55_00710 [Pseudomonadota bacterium]|nr:MAG: hypothetical protein HND55_00710 [Pseudomonadota bacterium]